MKCHLLMNLKICRTSQSFFHANVVAEGFNFRLVLDKIILFLNKGMKKSGMTYDQSRDKGVLKSEL